MDLRDFALVLTGLVVFLAMAVLTAYWADMLPRFPVEAQWVLMGTIGVAPGGYKAVKVMKANWANRP